MEFCAGGSCADLMKPGLIGEDYIAIIIRELLMGLDYLHSDKKLHRDIKGESRRSPCPPRAAPADQIPNRLQPPTFYWAHLARSSWPTLASRASCRPP